MDSNASIKISADPNDVDPYFVIKEIQNSHWGGKRSEKAILDSLKNSLCYSLFVSGKQVAFSRVVSDYSTFAYLCDVVVTSDHRGKGYSKKLLEVVFSDPKLKEVSWLLRTKDAHWLYEKFGFKLTGRPERYMEK
jgi:GNAT superfamily N-acetyltransferase